MSLAVTTLFWGAGATLRLVVLTWAVMILKFNTEQATQLTAVVAVGIAIGAVIAGRYVKLADSVKVISTGIIMGIAVMSMVFVTSSTTAALLLIIIGILGGFFVVPMNALLQHRGHLLMGAGHSIAVQNFNENLSILIMLGFYASLDKMGESMNVIILSFGAFISVSMLLIQYHYRHIDASNHG